MPGDPEECRQQGRECVRLAQQAATPQARKDYLTLAHTWLQLAAMFESDDVLMKSWGVTPSKVISLASRRRRPIKLRAS